MQKIEKWRIQELSLIFRKISDLLIKGGNPEWANVFSHFQQESQKIISKKEFDEDLLHKLIINTKNCFSREHTFIHMELWHEDPKTKVSINQEFLLTRARLLKIITDINNKMIELVS